MMIQPADDELKMMIDIAINLAPNYAIRRLILPSNAIDRRLAVEVLTDRIIKALARYQIMREALAHEEAIGTLPLFPDDDFHRKFKRKN
ncbi:MAG: hypothetical protein C0429_17325 [Sphingopyxis sp.]|nr:hypothetical protein [Sphingopyxis sp.]